MLANKNALELFNINLNTKVEGGVVQVRNVLLTGILVENAVELVVEKIDWSLLESNSLIAEKKGFAAGLTTLDDASLNLDMIQLLDSLQINGELKIKL